MMDFLQNLEPLLRVFWLIAIPTSLIFVVLTVMTFLGSDSMDGASADFDSNLSGTDAPFQLFSLRNLINFLLGFSWAGISFFSLVASPAALIGLALLVGLFFVFLFFLIIQQIQKLAEDNSFRYQETLGKTAEVYIPIPGHFAGKGKVLISVKGSVHELWALTEQEKLESGVLVKVVRLENADVLVVEKI